MYFFLNYKCFTNYKKYEWSGSNHEPIVLVPIWRLLWFKIPHTMPCSPPLALVACTGRWNYLPCKGRRAGGQKGCKCWWVSRNSHRDAAVVPTDTTGTGCPGRPTCCRTAKCKSTTSGQLKDTSSQLLLISMWLCCFSIQCISNCTFLKHMRAIVKLLHSKSGR